MGEQAKRGQGIEGAQGRPLRNDPYCAAARFSSEAASILVFRNLRDIASAEAGAALAVYRFHADGATFVAVEGPRPPEWVQEYIAEQLAHGEPVHLSDHIVDALRLRRVPLEESGELSDGHYPRRRNFDI